ncbi:hypothetical protein BLNAU_13533 [Blattamonas nauphoetae]|uniref:IPT/TIG domain-containing protein n=1 Tax=Blattamonas nauphoetae TaxID=2049346 RepID=A0ABQ9XHL9_9EUKA|nr:hypothetical protein BLNAU_13533 [Blattamonas nauphoetae]
MPVITSNLKLEGIALSISDCKMCHSTGPLFDFGTLDDRTNQLNVDCDVTLSDCTIRNVTTSNQVPIIDHHLRMTQKVVNCRLSSSFGNIWGAISCGLDTSGSLFGMNCSFSNIQPSSLHHAPHSLPTNTNSVFESPTRQEPTSDELTLISCRFFLQIEGAEALIHLSSTRSSSSRTVMLADCSFHECGCSEGSPSTLLLCGMGSVCLFDVSFVKCGGLNGSSIVVIENSIVDSNSSIHFIDSGSSELYLTDLVNTAELGLIGYTDSPSPSPFLSPVHKTHRSDRSNAVAHNSGTLTLKSSSEPYVEVLLAVGIDDYQIQFNPPYFSVPVPFIPVIPLIELSLDHYSEDRSTVALSFSLTNVYDGSYSVTLANNMNPADTWTTILNVDGGSTNFVASAILYQVDSDDVDLKWASTYTIDRVADEHDNPQHMDLRGSIRIQAEPTRIEGIESRSFSDKTVLTLTGRKFGTDFDFSLSPIASTSSRNAVSNPITASFVNSSAATCTIPAVDVSFGTLAPPVAFGAEYSIAASIIVNSGLSHTISMPVYATSIVPQMRENGKECTLLVTGSEFMEDEQFVLVLTESSESNADPVTLNFDVVMRSSTEGESSPIELGKEDSLKFDTTYTIVNLHLSSDSSLTARTPSTLTTPSEPSLSTNVFHVDGGITTESNPCGTITSPCQTVNRALQIIQSALFMYRSILVTRGPVLSQSFEMQNGMTLILKKAGEFTETVKIPSTSVSSSPLLILTDSRTKLDHLSFTIENTSPSLCLFSATNTEVELEVENNETSQQESHWISTSECAVTVNGQKSLSPFVYPTLSVSDCSVSQNKSKDPLAIRVSNTVRV